ncbi:hypothetical protein DFH27DRAFT_622959 [Peziza echinospora]|nr:hypothetical protein DFH27DRAFT_622959 [Peziza echinospora]
MPDAKTPAPATNPWQKFVTPGTGTGPRPGRHLPFPLPPPAMGTNLFNKGGKAQGANSHTNATGAQLAPAYTNADASLTYFTKKGVKIIQCHICKKGRPLDKFSKRQIINMKWAEENGKVMTHLTCINCGKEQPLKKFMKTQRRTPDAARCKRCVQFDLNTQRGVEGVDEEDYEDDESEEDDSDVDVDAPYEDVYTDEKSVDRIASCFDSIALLDNDNTKTETTRAQTPSPQSVNTGKNDLMTLIPDLDDDSNASKTPLTWQTVGVAVKGSRNAFSAGYQSKVVSRAETGNTTPANTYASSGQKSNSSKPTKSWGKVKKTDFIMDNEWAACSDVAKRNGWSGYGGQPDIYKKKGKAKTRRDDDSDGDDE